MGFTGLARWINAPTTGLDLMKQEIIKNHGGIERQRWFLSVRSYRFVTPPTPGFQQAADRSMCALTMGNHSFVLLVDPTAPTRADYLQVVTQAQANAGTRDGNAASPGKQSIMNIPEPAHYHNTFMTVSPPGALEQLISQLGARWMPTRQSSSNQGRQSASAGQQLVIDGSIFSIGTDWLVRVGNVILAGGGIRGMLIEAEYLPLPTMYTTEEGTSDFISGLLASILPQTPGARAVAVAMTDAQWDEVLWTGTGDGEDKEETAETVDTADSDPDADLYAYEDKDDSSAIQTRDWIGVKRNRRSAFLIIMALRSEGIL